MSKKGFTLTEVLIVVVIAVTVTAFAVPAYKRTQDKARYNAAAGVLAQLGAAVQALRTDMAMEGMSYSFPKSNASGPSAITNVPTLTVAQNWVKTSHPQYATARDAQSLSSLDTNEKLAAALFARGYMGELPLDSNGRIGDYTFYICPKSSIALQFGHCCNDTGVVCMVDSSASSRDSTEYGQGVYSNDGQIKHSKITSISVTPGVLEPGVNPKFN